MNFVLKMMKCRVPNGRAETEREFIIFNTISIILNAKYIIFNAKSITFNAASMILNENPTNLNTKLIILKTKLIILNTNLCESAGCAAYERDFTESLTENNDSVNRKCNKLSKTSMEISKMQ